MQSCLILCMQRRGLAGKGLCSNGVRLHTQHPGFLASWAKQEHNRAMRT